MTSWTRVEGATRSASLVGGVEARIADPLWMLARQWQVGEFAGDDASQPAAIRVAAEWDRLTTISYGGRTAPLPHDRPFEQLVEAAPLGVTGASRLAERGPSRPAAAPRARHGRRRRGVRRPARRVPARPARRSRGDAGRGSRGSRIDRPTFDRRRLARGRARCRCRRGAGPPRGATARRRPPGDRALAGALRVDPFGPLAEQLDPRADGALVLGRRPSSRRLADRAHGGRVHRWPPRLVLLRRGSRARATCWRTGPIPAMRRSRRGRLRCAHPP